MQRVSGIHLVSGPQMLFFINFNKQSTFLDSKQMYAELFH